MMAITIADYRQVLKDAGIKRSTVDGLDPDKPLISQGLDSLDLAVIETATEEHYGLTRKQTTEARINSIDELVAYVNKQGVTG